MYLTIGPTYLPENRLSIEELGSLERFAKDSSVLREQDGFVSIPAGRDGDNVDYAVRAWNLLHKCISADVPLVQTIFLIGHMEDAGWERVVNFRFSNEIGLPPHARVMQIKSGNGIAVLDALGLAANAIERVPDQRVGLVSAEKVNIRFVRRRNGSQVFGDAAIACLASRDLYTDQALTVRLIGNPAILTDSRFFEVRPGGMMGDQDLITSARRLCAEVVDRSLQQAGISRGDITYVSTQNLSRRLWNQIENNQSLPGTRLDSRDQLAHVPCVDLLANISMAWAESRLPRGSLILGLSLGMGLAAGAAIFEVQ
jgi:3-oxoacyl-[acyl-carrier-protein] synthase III